MTIGKKLKYFRGKLGITQNRLAELAGLNPAVIRKYETDVNIPQMPQIEKLAAALGVAPITLAGFGYDHFSIETYGDLCGLLIFFVRMGFLKANGERDEETHYISAEDFALSINPLIANVFSASDGNTSFDAKQLTLKIKSDMNVFTQFVKWEGLLDRRNILFEKYQNVSDENKKEFYKSSIDKLDEDIDIIELELQRSQILLDTANGIKTLVNPPLRK